MLTVKPKRKATPTLLHHSFWRIFVIFGWLTHREEKQVFSDLDRTFSSYEPSALVNNSSNIQVAQSHYRTAFISSSKNKNRKRRLSNTVGMQSIPRALFLPVLLPLLPPSLLTRLLSRKATDRSCHFATVLCSTQPATGSVSSWPLAALQPSLVSVLFLKHCIKIIAERVCLCKSVVNWNMLTQGGW